MPVFEQQKSAQPPYQYDGQALQWVLEFKYVGLILWHKGGYTKALQDLSTRGRRGMFLVRHRCHWLLVNDPACICRMFHAKVLPLLSNGCEV